MHICAAARAGHQERFDMDAFSRVGVTTGRTHHMRYRVRAIVLLPIGGRTPATSGSGYPPW